MGDVFQPYRQIGAHAPGAVLAMLQVRQTGPGLLCSDRDGWSWVLAEIVIEVHAVILSKDGIKSTLFQILCDLHQLLLALSFMNGMTVVKENRRKNMQALIERLGGHGAQRKLAELTGISYKFINNLLRGDREISETTARKIEQSLQLAAGWMDRDWESEEPTNPVGLDKEAVRLALAIQSLSPKDRATLQALVDSLAQPKAYGTGIIKKTG